MSQQNSSSFIWSVADLLRGDYKQSKYGRVILPFTVLRRLDCVLEPSNAAVLAEREKCKAMGLNQGPFILKRAAERYLLKHPIGTYDWGGTNGMPMLRKVATQRIDSGGI